MSSPLLSFHMAAQDFLQLIAKKAKQAAVNSEAAKELAVLEGFYDMVNSLVTQCEIEAHETKLLTVTEHATNRILEAEIRKAYNLVHKSGNADLLASILKTTPLLSKAELSQDVQIKNQNNG